MIEENERAEFVLLGGSRRFKTAPKISRAASFKIDSDGMKSGPDKSRTIKRFRAGRAPTITRTQPFIDGVRDTWQIAGQAHSGSCDQRVAWLYFCGGLCGFGYRDNDRIVIGK